MDTTIDWNQATTDQDDWGDVALVIDTDAYSGNFERELLVAATGVMPEYPNEITEKVARAWEGAGVVYDTLVGWLTHNTDDETHADRCMIYPTPGWGNDGYGVHYRVTEDRPAAFPAYQSVKIPLDRPPSREELADIQRRALAFAADPRTQYIEPFTITGFRLVRERTERQSIPV